MASFNKVILLGNLTRDPELRYTPKGTAVTEVSLAINRFRSGESGEKTQEVTYVDVTLWSRQAEVAKEYLTKGNPVLIEGRLQLDSWEDKQSGQNRSRLKVVGEQMQLLPKGGNSGNSNTKEGDNYSPPSSSPVESTPSTSVSDDDEIPF